MHDLVAPVHDVAFLGDEDVLTLGEKDPLVAVLAAGKAVKLQVDGRRRWRRLQRPGCLSGGNGFGMGASSACERKMSRPVPL